MSLQGQRRTLVPVLVTGLKVTHTAWGRGVAAARSRPLGASGAARAREHARAGQPSVPPSTPTAARDFAPRRAGRCGTCVPSPISTPRSSLRPPWRGSHPDRRRGYGRAGAQRERSFCWRSRETYAIRMPTVSTSRCAQVVFLFGEIDCREVSANGLMGDRRVDVGSALPRNLLPFLLLSRLSIPDFLRRPPSRPFFFFPALHPPPILPGAIACRRKGPLHICSRGPESGRRHLRGRSQNAFGGQLVGGALFAGADLDACRCSICPKPLCSSLLVARLGRGS